MPTMAAHIAFMVQSFGVREEAHNGYALNEMAMMLIKKNSCIKPLSGAP